MMRAAMRRSPLPILALALLLVPGFLAARQATSASAKAKALDDQVVAESKKNPQILANLTYISDMIGPRLTGSPALQRANDWTADKMKAYGLVNVHKESWLIPEGWERGSANGRIIEPDTGFKLSLASMGWSPGTAGKIQGDVVILGTNKVADLASLRGKLKGAIILRGEPAKLPPIEGIDKGSLFGDAGQKKGKAGGGKGNFGPQLELEEFLKDEGVAAILTDANKHLGLLATTGSWGNKDRVSSLNKIARCSVAHEHYSMLYRLAAREGVKTRVELEVTNKFIPGPITVYNTVGEIRGSEKPDEYVVVGAHLDSWDLGQGTLDNGCGSCVVLETARILAKMPPPRRTIRFVLFSGEEQGLFGSKAYVEKHKDELPFISAALVHDTGTGKVTGLGWMSNHDALTPIMEAELQSLKDLGVQKLCTSGFGGSDHATFDRVGVPGCAYHQEIAGYRFGHHSQADTLDLAREPDLLQGVQVMGITALRLANRDGLLPRSPAKGNN
jgi:carboxypeptidase Q